MSVAHPSGTRKAIEWAQGILAGKYSGESGNDLRRVAEAVILSEQAGQDDTCFRFA
ncbi:MAG: hypothetical protein ABSH09_30700 [Bryobacteraceae bacterium]